MEAAVNSPNQNSVLRVWRSCDLAIGLHLSNYGLFAVAAYDDQRCDMSRSTGSLWRFLVERSSWQSERESFVLINARVALPPSLPKTPKEESFCQSTVPHNGERLSEIISSCRLAPGVPYPRLNPSRVLFRRY